MKQHGRLFKAEMVRAILGGHKTATRRVVTKHNSVMDRGKFDDVDLGTACADGRGGDYCLHASVRDDPDERVCRISSRVQTGDVLWVRETWRVDGGAGKDEIHYRADLDEAPAPGCWKPSIFLPRWASRIDLLVTGVRVERVQCITASDVRAEGVGTSSELSDDATLALFQSLWGSINGKRAGCSWADNPWVWAYTFERVTP